MYAPNSPPPPPPPSTPDFTQSSHTGTNARTCTVELGLLILLQSYPCKRRFPVRFRVLTGLTHATLRADCGSCVLARLMHATGLCATGGCRIQASTRDRLVHKSGLCTRHYGNFTDTAFGNKTTLEQTRAMRELQPVCFVVVLFRNAVLSALYICTLSSVLCRGNKHFCNLTNMFINTTGVQTVKKSKNAQM